MEDEICKGRVKGEINKVLEKRKGEGGKKINLERIGGNEEGWKLRKIKEDMSKEILKWKEIDVRKIKIEKK